MANKAGLKFDFQIDKNAVDYFTKEAPQKLQEARKNAVTAMGMIWADETKQLTRDENHIDTSLYINSIGYLTNIPATNKTGNGQRNATQDDVIYDLVEDPDQTTLTIGSNVAYAETLEKRFNLMARGLDIAKPRMEALANVQIKKVLGL